MASHRKQNWDDEHRQKIDEAWRSFKHEGDEQARQFLIESYLPMVRKHARSILAKRPALLTYDDLYNAGVLGLMDAINKFNLDMGNEFYTYAPIRIKGAIIDSVNALDWTPRSMREYIKAALKAIDKWTTEYSDTNNLNFNDAEFIEYIKTETKIPEHKIREALTSISKTYVYPMYSANFLLKEGIDNGMKEYDHEASKIVDFVSTGQSLSGTMRIDELLDQDEIQSVVGKITDICDEDERRVLTLIFWEKRTLHQIAEELGKTIGWVAKTRENAFAKLRQELKDEELPFKSVE